MLQIKIEEDKLEAIYREMVREKLQELENSTVYWDTKDLVKHSKMCWATIQDKFLYDDDFPKFRSDNKWRFPAKECRKYLEHWWKRQPKN